jgi:hypothetical protein
VEDRPAAAPQDVPWTPDFKLFKNPPFHSAIAAIGSLIFAYGGIPAMFSVIAEMKDPRDFKKSLAFAQITLTVTYLVRSTGKPSAYMIIADKGGRRHRRLSILRQLRI